jgi:hypothetical protein
MPNNGRNPAKHHAYQGNRVGDNAIAILGSVHGDIYIPDNASREPCLRALGASDPRVEKDRIELNKDRLLKDCYSWILDNLDFQRSEQSRLLWIKGDPGKGKTMMMIALADDLSRQSSYFGLVKSPNAIALMVVVLLVFLQTKVMSTSLLFLTFTLSSSPRLSAETSSPSMIP